MSCGQYLSTVLMAALVLLCCGSSSHLHSQVSALVVHSPPSLAGPGFVAIAAFGPTFVTTRDQRGDLVVANPFDGCSTFTNSDSFYDAVVLVKRGGCTFREKVQAAQDHGAVGVVIVNSESATTPEEEKARLFLLADDNLGYNIHIPAEMITRSEGLKFVEAVLRHGKRVSVSLGHAVDTADYYL